jgi:hypothetical protein
VALTEGSDPSGAHILDGFSTISSDVCVILDHIISSLTETRSTPASNKISWVNPFTKRATEKRINVERMTRNNAGSKRPLIPNTDDHLLIEAS